LRSILYNTGPETSLCQLAANNEKEYTANYSAACQTTTKTPYYAKEIRGNLEFFEV